MDYKHNEAVKDFLLHYCKLPKPGYAVLVKGNWGVGKTYFIKHLLKDMQDQSFAYLYTSLYGVRSFGDIESDFFQQLHPLLSSKGITTLGNIGQMLIHATLKYDVIKNKRRLFTKKSSDIPEYMKKSNHTIVFDDLERCSIELNDVLGYINKYIEHNQSKVIIIANEEEIYRLYADKSDIKYEIIKEKIVGKTFTINPDVESAFSDFTSEVIDDRVKKLFKDNSDTIISIFRESKFQNLRILKHALQDYAWLYQHIDQELIQNKKLTKHLMEVLMILSYEHKCNCLAEQELSRLKSTALLNQFGSSGDSELTTYKKIVEKYSTDSTNDILMDGKVWADIIINGIVNSVEINKVLEKSRYFIQDIQPTWIKLWHYFDSSQDEFENNLRSVEKEFSNKDYKEIGIIKHIASLLMMFSNMDLYEKSLEEILETAKDNVDNLAKLDRLASENENEIFDEDESWGGLGFTGKDIQEFKKLCDYIRAKRKEVLARKLPKEAKELLSLMRNDPQLFYDRIILGNNRDSKYYNIPILKHISPKEFLSHFMSIKPENQRTVVYALKKRYQYEEINKQLESERDWISLVIKEFQDNIASMEEGLNRKRAEVLLLPKIQEAEKLLNKSF